MTEKIPIRKVRNYLETINISAAFLRQNFKPIGHALAILVLPFILISMIAITLCVYSFTEVFAFSQTDTFGTGDFSGFDDIGLGFVIYFFIFFGAISFGLVSFIATIYGYLQLYLEAEDIKQITIQDIVKRAFWDTWVLLGNLWVLTFLLMLAMFPLILLLSMGALGVLLFWILYTYLWITLSLVFIVQLIEKINIFDAIGRCFSLVRGHWWDTFGLNIVLTLMLICLSMVPYLALILVVSAQGVFIAELGDVTNSFVIKIIAILLNTMVLIAYILPNALYLLGLAFRYFSLVEIKEATGMFQQIQKLREI